jgi:1-acyl-sn-glycerol-3-phosphate acyltransferase
MRARLKIALVFASMIAFYARWQLGRPFFRDSVAWRMRTIHDWSRALARIVNLRVRVEGAPPRGAFLLVSNHLSYLDIAVISAALPTRFVAKQQVSRWPLIGRITRDLDTLFVDRDSIVDTARTAERIEAGLRAGAGITLFPEGTSSPGDRVLPFQPPLLAAAARLDMPVHSCALSYKTPRAETPAHLSVCWWGDMTFAEHLAKLVQHSQIEAILRFAAQPARETDRKKLARALHADVSALFIPVVDAETAARDRQRLEREWKINAHQNSSQRTSMS